MFIRFDVMHECDERTDGRMDRRTLRDSKDRAYASHRAAKTKSKTTVQPYTKQNAIYYSIFISPTAIN